MNTLKQPESLLLGSAAAADALKKKSTARILVISDSHGQSELFKMIVQQLGTFCDALVFCGDGIGDFVSCCDYAAQDADFAKCLPSVAAFVSGNGDCDRFPAAFNPSNKRAKKNELYFDLKIPGRQILYAVGRTIFIVHGHREGVYYGTQSLVKESQLAGADIVLYGHTHIADETRSSVYMMNPGSIAHPRAGTPPSCAVLELGGENINTVFYRINVSGEGIQLVPFLPVKASLWM